MQRQEAEADSSTGAPPVGEHLLGRAQQAGTDGVDLWSGATQAPDQITIRST